MGSVMAAWPLTVLTGANADRYSEETAKTAAFEKIIFMFRCWVVDVFIYCCFFGCCFWILWIQKNEVFRRDRKNLKNKNHRSLLRFKIRSNTIGNNSAHCAQFSRVWKDRVCISRAVLPRGTRQTRRSAHPKKKIRLWFAFHRHHPISVFPRRSKNKVNPVLLSITSKTFAFFSCLSKVPVVCFFSFF